MKINELKQLTTAQQIVESLSRNTDTKTAQYMRTMYENFTVPFITSLQSKSILSEAQLTSQQITDIFQQAEQGMSDLGANRSFLGKGADVASAAGQDLAAAGKGVTNMALQGAQKIKDLAAKVLSPKQKQQFVQNLPPADAGPVQNFEQQAQEAAAQIQDPKAKQSVMDLIKQGVNNPVTQTLILTAVSGIAGIVAGPAIAGLGLPLAATAALTGSVVGGLTGLVRGKMQGKGWKDAGMDALKGAGMGAAVGGVGGALAQGAQAVAHGWQQHQADAQAQRVAGEPDFKLPDDVQAKNNEVQNSAAQEWANASPAEKLQIQRVTGMSSDQLDQLSKNPLPTTFPDSQPDLGKFDAGTGQGWDAGGAQKHTTQSIGPDTPSDGSYRQAAPIGRDGQPMQQVPMDDNGGSDFSQDEINAPIPVDQKVQDLASQEAAKYGRTTPNQNDIKAAEIMARSNPQTMPIKNQADLDDYVQQSINAGRTPTAPAGNYTPTGNPWVDQLNRSAANGIRLREYIDSRQTARAWLLRESLGRERGGVALTEAGITAVFEGLGDYFKTMGKNLTNKVTVDKLKSAWQKADMPDDSEQIAALLQKAGVGKAVINGIFKNMGIPTAGAGGTTATPAAGATGPGGAPAGGAGEENPMAQQGAAKTQLDLPGGQADDIGGAVTNAMAGLMKSGTKTRSVAAPTSPTPTSPTPTSPTPTAPTAAAAPAADATSNDAEVNNEPANAPNPFGQMTGQLKSYAPPEKTSTGGTLTQTPTGQVHRANPNNPNAQANRAAAANQQQQQATQNAQPKRSVTGDVPVPANFGQAPQGQAPQAATPQARQSLAQKMATRGQAVKAPNAAVKQWTGRPKVQVPTNESFTRDFGAMLWKQMRDGK